ncbi:MAG: hypothetical protein DID92_2727745671 [Candidatus Nitrotoga sp. SPKER]|nr:MAG: hypothetical protein DID92_2727745671 [Candidatus Nitrotoga sp. SPKER]
MGEVPVDICTTNHIAVNILPGRGKSFLQQSVEFILGEYRCTRSQL